MVPKDKLAANYSIGFNGNVHQLNKRKDEEEEADHDDDDDEWIPDDSALAEIDQFVLTHSSQLHSVGFRSHVVPENSPGSFIQGDNLFPTGYSSIPSPSFLKKENMTTTFSSFPDLEPETVHSELLLKKGEVQLLRQRLQTLEHQLTEVTKTHQQEKKTWQQRWLDQTLLHQQEIEALNTRLMFLSMQQHQQKWNSNLSSSSSSSSSSTTAATEKTLTSYSTYPPNLTSKRDQATSPCLKEGTTLSLGVSSSPLPSHSCPTSQPSHFSIPSSPPLIPKRMLHFLHGLLHVEGWHPPSLPYFFTHVFQGHPKAMCFGSELAMESFQQGHFPITLEIMHFFMWFHEHISVAWMDEVLSTLTDPNDVQRIDRTVLQLVVLTCVHHYKTQELLDELLVVLFQFLGKWCTASPARALAGYPMYQTYVGSEECTYVVNPSSPFSIRTKLAMVRWLIYVIPVVPKMESKKTPSLVSELIKYLEPFHFPFNEAWDFRCEVVRFCFLYFHVHPDVFVMYASKWVLWIHDTWCTLTSTTSTDSGIDLPSALLMLYYGLQTLNDPFPGSPSVLPFTHPSTQDTGALPSTFLPTLTLLDVFQKKPLLQRYLKTVLDALVTSPSTQEGWMALSTQKASFSHTLPSRLRFQWAQRHCDSFFIQLQRLAKQVRMQFFP
ncbi:hypothetical protein HMI55_000330 [Coelomomyces lativittatus]|nr:hypothetical protein HMI55_000330 [Coelomomyces lativittatus]KAJ1511946.1 hypothetical protein HMI56_004719 [Coelomomyces lativittatus]